MAQRKIFGKLPAWEMIGAIAGVVGSVVAVWQFLAPASAPSATPAPQATHSSAAQATNGQTPQGVSAAPGEPKSHLFKDIVLVQHAGVDIDGAAPVVTPGLGGITGDNDVYHDAGEVSSNRLYTPNGLYEYTGNPATAYKTCRDYLADTTHTLNGYIGFSMGESFCFMTSSGHLALLQVTALDGSPGIYHSITFNVRVWDN